MQQHELFFKNQSSFHLYKELDADNVPEWLRGRFAIVMHAVRRSSNLLVVAIIIICFLGKGSFGTVEARWIPNPGVGSSNLSSFTIFYINQHV